MRYRAAIFDGLPSSEYNLDSPRIHSIVTAGSSLLHSKLPHSLIAPWMFSGTCTHIHTRYPESGGDKERGTTITTTTTTTNVDDDHRWTRRRRFPQKSRGERCRRDPVKQLVTVDRGARTKASAILSRAFAATRKVDGRRWCTARRDATRRERARVCESA